MRVYVSIRSLVITRFTFHSPAAIDVSIITLGPPHSHPPVAIVFAFIAFIYFRFVSELSAHLAVKLRLSQFSQNADGRRKRFMVARSFVWPQ